jgi:hypothetical protein
LKISPPPAFLQQIELNQFIFPARGNFHRRQAAAVHRQAVACFQAARGNFRSHRQRNGFRAARNFFDRAGFLDNAREHLFNLAAGRDSVEPCLINPRRHHQIFPHLAPFDLAQLNRVHQTFCALACDAFERITPAQNFRRVKKCDTISKTTEQK